MSQERFEQVCRDIAGQRQHHSGIGTLAEKTLHAVLKRYLEPDETKHEMKVGRHVADIVNDSGIIEIQTRAFNALRPKLEAYLAAYPVTVVYPIARTKWLYWIDLESGSITNKRKSPKTGTYYDAFRELYKIKPYLHHPNLHIRLLLLDIEEYRYLDGWSTDKKKGSSRCERIPVGLVDELDLHCSVDYAQLIPAALSGPFTTKDFAKAAAVRQKTAQTVVHLLHHMGALYRTGKQGRAYLYEKNDKKATD